MPRSTTSAIFASISARSGASGVLVSNSGTAIAQSLEASSPQVPARDVVGANMRMPHILVATIAATLAIAAPAAAEPTWAPADSAPVHPGVQTVTDGGQCTANFVFFDGSEQRLHRPGRPLLRAPAAATEHQRLRHGLAAARHARRGRRRQQAGHARLQLVAGDAGRRARPTRTPATYNDLALVKLDPADYGKVNPSIPFWGGPTGITDTVAQGEKVLSYGNSSLRLGITQLSPKEGLSLGQTGGGWSHEVYTVSPGIPGDSGSAFINRDGKAFGVLSTLQIAPKVGANGVGDLSRELAYANANGARRAARQRHRGLHGPAAARSTAARSAGPGGPSAEHRGWAFALHGVSH